MFLNTESGGHILICLFAAIIIISAMVAIMDYWDRYRVVLVLHGGVCITDPSAPWLGLDRIAQYMKDFDYTLPVNRDVEYIEVHRKALRPRQETRIICGISKNGNAYSASMAPKEGRVLSPVLDGIKN